jgi:predicted RNase H-like HicB family nuclease
MKEAYPVVITKTDDNGYYVFIPDFDISTQGNDIPDAIYMARDAIGLIGADKLDDGVELPKPNTIKFDISKYDIVTLVDIDFDEFKRKLNYRSVKKNCTLPYWLCRKAENNDINFSKVLQDALIEKLK